MQNHEKCCFDSVEKCKKDYIQTNERYKNFCQTYFTAGDEDQFSNSIPKLNVKPSARVGIDNILTPPNLSWEKYQQLTGDHVYKTFRYIFNKLKKGCFVSLIDGNLNVLPFSKSKFINEWSSQIHVQPKFKTVTNFIKFSCDLEKRTFKEERINKFPSQWYANNCLVRFEYPTSESDTGIHHVVCMFTELCEKYKIELPDIEFFINRRDFPILKRDGTEPYDHIWNSDKKPLISHNYDKYVPILSSVTRDDFADIPIPTSDDWARVKQKEGRYLPKTQFRDYHIATNISWQDKKAIAVFRGSSTGFGVTVDTNPRLKISKMSFDNKKDTDGLPFLDAGITEWNFRIRKIKGEPYLQTIQPDTFPFSTVKRLTPSEQTRFKYLVNIDGHTSAFRLSLELAMGSVILKVDSPYKLWYSHLLHPYIHYIPIKSDLSDLYAKISWCKQNDSECEQIAKNAVLFYQTYLTKDGILKYMLNLLCKIKQITGSYSYPPNPVIAQIAIAEKFLSVNHELPIRIVNQYTDTFHANLVMRLTNRYNIKLGDELQLYKSNKTCVCMYAYKDTIKVVGKKSANKTESIHEAFVGIKAINSLTLEIPTFNYTFEYINDQNCVVSSYVKGMTFMEWLSSPEFDFDNYISILAQIALSLHIAQKRIGFVHHDLFPWNIIIANGKEAEYIIDYKTVVKVFNPLFTPVIIDYGKSHIIYENEHYGLVNRYKFDTMIDIITIVMSSVNVLIKTKQIAHFNNDRLIHLVNFIRPIDTFEKIRQFIFDNCNFSSMINFDTTTISIKTPFEFYRYITGECVFSTSKSVLPKRKSICWYLGKKPNYYQKLKLFDKSSIEWMYAILYLSQFDDFDFTEKITFDYSKKYNLPQSQNVFENLEDFDYLDKSKHSQKFDSINNRLRTMLEKIITNQDFLDKFGIDRLKLVEIYLPLLETHYCLQ